MTLEYIKKIDKKSMKRLKEDVDGPCNVCICDLLKEPDEPGLMGHIKRGVRCIHDILNKEEPGPSKLKGKGKKGAKGKKQPPGKKGAKGKLGKGAKGGKASGQSSKVSNKSNKSAKGAKGK